MAQNWKFLTICLTIALCYSSSRFCIENFSKFTSIFEKTSQSVENGCKILEIWLMVVLRVSCLKSLLKLNTLIYSCNKIHCEKRCQSMCIIRQQEMICWTPAGTAEFHTFQLDYNLTKAALTFFFINKNMRIYFYFPVLCFFICKSKNVSTSY